MGRQGNRPGGGLPHEGMIADARENARDLACAVIERLTEEGVT